VASLPPFPVAVPLIVAAGLLALNGVLPRRVVDAVALVTGVTVVIIAAVLLHQAGAHTVITWFGGWTPQHGTAIGVSFVVDPIGAGGVVLAGVVIIVALAITRRTVGPEGTLVHALLLVVLGGAAGFCLTGDLFNMFVFFELMAVATIGLAAYQSDDLAALRGALNFAITNSIGAFAVLSGIALLYGRTGTLNLAQIGRRLAAGGTPDRLVIVAFTLILVGFLIKAAVVPFHFWLIDAASSAPLPLAMVFAGVLDLLGVYGVARVYWTCFGGDLQPHAAAIRTVLIVVGCVSAVVAGGLSMNAHQPRRMVAFVMVSHTGILLVAVGVLSGPGVAAFAVYAVGDSFAKLALLCGVGLLGRSGRAGWLIVASGVALAGLPPLATGVGKAAIDTAATRAGAGWAVPILVLASMLTGSAAIRVGLDTLRSASGRVAGGGVLWTAGGSLLSASLAVGLLLPGWAARAGQRFVDIGRYQALVLGGGPSPAAVGRVPVAGLTRGGAVVDLSAVAVAIVLAALPDSARRVVAGKGRRMGATLRALHSGSIADSAVWVTVGTAVIGVVLAASIR